VGKPEFQEKISSRLLRSPERVELVEGMLALHKRAAGAKTGHERTSLQRQIAATDAQIGRLVYELYGLSEEEIAVVERNLHKEF
jgi:hypothetical protein